jgi:hypothetical protein
MPSSSKKQHNFMEAVAHSPGFAKKVGVPQSVGKDFSAADKGRRFDGGGDVSTEDRSTINAAEEQGFRFNPDQMTAAEENEAEIRQALAEAKNDSQKLKIYKARSMSAAEKARADKAAKEAQENEDSAVEGMKKGGKVKKSSDKKWIAKAAKKPGKMGQRARLAQTSKGFKEGGSIRGGGCESRGKTRCKIV